MNPDYLGRIAPTPTGRLHLGHAATFHTAYERAVSRGGRLLLRFEDLDSQRCREQFVAQAIEDLRWLGIRWDEPPLFQSSRRPLYLAAWFSLRDQGLIYPCRRSRKDVANASLAPHDEEPLFPKEWRSDPAESSAWENPSGMNWRFRVPDGRAITFHDGKLGAVTRTAGVDFGDFVIWNREDVPAYELAVVVDDDGITEVVRGADLLTSTARQILLHEALSQTAPAWFHCPLVLDGDGRCLAKRSGALELARLRDKGMSPKEVLQLAASKTQSSSF